MRHVQKLCEFQWYIHHSVCAVLFFSILVNFVRGVRMCVRDFVLPFIWNAPLLKSHSTALIHYNNLLNSSLMQYCLLGWDTIYSSFSISFSLLFELADTICSFLFLYRQITLRTDWKYPIIAQVKKKSMIHFDFLSTPLQKMYNRSSAEKSPICIVIWNLKFLLNAPLLMLFFPFNSPKKENFVNQKHNRTMLVKCMHTVFHYFTQINANICHCEWLSERRKENLQSNQN